MKFNVLTLFPELFEQYLSQTILKRAVDKNIIDYEIINIRDYARNKHSQMDDIPFGGGAGMVLKPEAYWNYFYENFEYFKNENLELKKPYVIFLSPQGKQLTHKKVTELSQKDEIVLISGRYEGLDQRVNCFPCGDKNITYGFLSPQRFAVASFDGFCHSDKKWCNKKRIF